LNSLKLETFNSFSKNEQEDAIQTVFEIYRSKNIYPIFYFNDEGIKNEIIRCFNRNVSFSGNTMDFKFTQGNTLLKFMFPNFQKAYSGIKDNCNYINSFDKFYDDEILKGVIRFQLRYDSPIPLRLLSVMSLYRDRPPTNFAPMRAKAIFEKYTPKNGIVYDFSSGFGGRMLGALTSKNNYKYIGVDPSSESFNNLNFLGEKIESALGKKNLFEIYRIGSEDYIGEKSSIDFAFSSPPYFNLEKYTDEETQCYNKYKDVDTWFNQYVVQTIKNIHIMLKSDGIYAVNISDFNLAKGNVFNFVRKWIEISEKIGFDNIEIINMKLSNRGGNKRPGTGGSNRKEEKIYVFRKVASGRAKNYINRDIPLFIKEKIKDYNKLISSAERIREEVINWSKEYSFENIDKVFEKPLE
jgi:hypothetical protein